MDEDDYSFDDLIGNVKIDLESVIKQEGNLYFQLNNNFNRKMVY